MPEGKEILAELARLEGNLADTYALISRIKAALNEVDSQTEQLELENMRLRERLKSLEAGEGATQQGIESLKKLYQDGFHICNPFYGKRLLKGESCGFCDSVLYK